MDIELKRFRQDAVCTIGVMTIGEGLPLYTLEDVVREVSGKPVESWKVFGKTAIPRGRYRVTITPSQRFKRDMPLLNDVPGFAGVRIHPGNTAADTEGCILVGLGLAADAITQSRDAFNRLFPMIQGAIARGEEVWITIK